MNDVDDNNILNKKGFFDNDLINNSKKTFSTSASYGLYFIFLFLRTLLPYFRIYYSKPKFLGFRLEPLSL